MSQYTGDQILSSIAEQGDAIGLDWTEADLSGIDLGEDYIQFKREEWTRRGNRAEPPWYSLTTGGVGLSGAKLCRTDLHGANLVGADLFSANIAGAHLLRANLTKANLSWANVEGAYFLEAVLERTQITQEKFGSGIGEEKDKRWDAARRAYHGLKMNWTAQGEYGYARWAHRKERQMERKANWQRQNRNILWRIWDRATNWLDERIWDYGQSPWLIMLWLVIMVLVWAGLYSVTNSLTAAHWYDYLFFSLRTSVTLVFTEMGQTQGEWIKLLTAVQGVLGLLGYAAVIYALGRRSAGF